MTKNLWTDDTELELVRKKINTARRLIALSETCPDTLRLPGLVHGASPDQIEEQIHKWTEKRRVAEEALRWLRELQAARATQVLLGAWPPE